MSLSCWIIISVRMPVILCISAAIGRSGFIPYDERVIDAEMRGELPLESSPPISEAAERIKEELLKRLGEAR